MPPECIDWNVNPSIGPFDQNQPWTLCFHPENRTNRNVDSYSIYNDKRGNGITSLQAISITGAVIDCWSLGIELPVLSISQHLTLLSQLPAMSKLLWVIDEGLKAMQVTESSGGITTSRSIIGLWPSLNGAVLTRFEIILGRLLIPNPVEQSFQLGSVIKESTRLIWNVI